MSNLTLKLRDTITGVEFVATPGFYEIVKVERPNQYILVGKVNPFENENDLSESANKPPRSMGRRGKEVKVEQDAVEVSTNSVSSFLTEEPTDF